MRLSVWFTALGLNFSPHRRFPVLTPTHLVDATTHFFSFSNFNKVYLESYRGSGSEPAGLRRLKKQVREAEGPLELRGVNSSTGKAGCAPSEGCPHSPVFKN